MGVSLRFEDVNDETTIEVWATKKNNCIIIIEDDNSNVAIELDKETAIKFSKELRKQIALIDSL